MGHRNFDFRVRNKESERRFYTSPGTPTGSGLSSLSMMTTFTSGSNLPTGQNFLLLASFSGSWKQKGTRCSNSFLCTAVVGGFYINGITFFSPKSLETFGFCFLFSHISKHLWTKEVVISFFSANFTLISERWLCPLEYPFKHGSSQHGRFVRVEWPDVNESLVQHSCTPPKRGWELFQSWVTRFGREFCSTLMHTAKTRMRAVSELSDQVWTRVLFNTHAHRQNEDESCFRVEWPGLDESLVQHSCTPPKRGWELFQSWVTRFGWEFCSTLMHTAKRGWELYESWVTRFGWEFCSTVMRTVKQGWELDESWVTWVGWESCSIGLMHDDVLLINFTTTPRSHALFGRFFHLPSWYSFQFLSFGKRLHFECEAWWRNWSAKRHYA